MRRSRLVAYWVTTGLVASSMLSAGVALRGETGDQTDQESRSAGRRTAPSMTAMDITIHWTFKE